MYQCSKHGWVSIYDPCPQCITIGVSIASDNTEINIQPSTPDKKMTPMAAHIGWLKIRVQYLRSRGSNYLADELQEAINHAIPLLEAEREMVEKTWDDAYAVGCVVGGNDYTNEQEEDTGFHYFTQNYRQQ